jgi:hypothetical protein
MTKYKKYIQEMYDSAPELFTNFQPVHDGYKVDRKKWSKQFHEQGQPVVDLMREWENRLCSGMERGKNAAYSARLADKFWDEVKQRFSHIQLVGVRSNFE